MLCATPSGTEGIRLLPETTALPERANPEEFFMKIQFNPKDLLPKLRLAKSATVKSITPILQNVKIIADAQSGTVLHATDTELGIRIRFKCKVLEDGSALLPVKRLIDILGSTKASQIHLASIDGGIALECDGEEYTFLTHSPDEFPDVSDFNAESYHEIPASTMQATIQQTVFAIDKENARYALSGVCFESDQRTITAVATDGRQLAWQSAVGETIGDPSIDRAIVPAKTLTLLDKILKDKSIKRLDKVKMVADVKVNSDGQTSGTVFFQCGDFTLFSCLREGRYPKWRSIIPKADDMTCALVNCGELRTAVNSVKGVITDFEPGIYLTFDKGRLMLIGEGKEVGKTKKAIPLTYDGQKRTFKMSVSFLTAYLKVLDAKTKLSIYLPAETSDPILIRCTDDYHYVVMPLSYKDEELPAECRDIEENVLCPPMVEGEADVEPMVETEPGIEVKPDVVMPEVELDSNGFVTWEYNAEHVPQRVSIGGDEYHLLERPYWCVEQSVFTAEATTDQTEYVLEWLSDGKHCDWNNPSRVEWLGDWLAKNKPVETAAESEDEESESNDVEPQDVAELPERDADAEILDGDNEPDVESTVIAAQWSAKVPTETGLYFIYYEIGTDCKQTVLVRLFENRAGKLSVNRAGQDNESLTGFLWHKHNVQWLTIDESFLSGLLDTLPTPMAQSKPAMTDNTETVTEREPETVVPKVALPTKIIYHSDPGHGWLAVKRALIEALGIERNISSFSYQRGDTVYLEEDGDSDCFFEAMIAAGYTSDQIHERIEERRVPDHHSPIRSYDSYTPTVRTERKPVEVGATTPPPSCPAHGGKSAVIQRENGASVNGTIFSTKQRDCIIFEEKESGKLYRIPAHCCTRQRSGGITFVSISEANLLANAHLLGMFTVQSLF